MAKNQKDLVGSSAADEGGGRRKGLLAKEDEFDRRTLWRLGSWGIGSIAAVILAILAFRSGPGVRQGQLSAADLARQSQQFQSIAKASENEANRLASAIETLNRDRDRLFARVTALEQGFESVTGSISRNPEQNQSPITDAGDASPPTLSAASATVAGSLPPIEPDRARTPDPSNTAASKSAEASTDVHPPPAGGPVDPAGADGTVVADTSAAKAAPVESSPDGSSADPGSAASRSANSTSTPASPAAASTRPMPINKRAASKTTVLPDPAATSPGERGENASAAPAPSAAADIAVAHTDFGVDLGSARSIKGLRTLWHGILKSNARELDSLYPIIVLKERGNGGHGMQLRLVAGPLSDAAAAAKICAVLSENGRACETAVFDGQRLETKENGTESAAAVPIKKPGATHASSRHRHSRRSARIEEPSPSPPPPPPEPQPPTESKPATFGSFFSR
jgi:hypothetical protein